MTIRHYVVGGSVGHLEQKPKAKHCKGIEGLLAEGAECLEEEAKGTLRDLQLIGAAQRVEHYEVAAYGTAKAMAEKLGISEAAEPLAETLEEEEKADKKLTEVAEGLYGEVENRGDGRGRGGGSSGAASQPSGRRTVGRKAAGKCDASRPRRLANPRRPDQ